MIDFCIKSRFLALVLFVCLFFSCTDDTFEDSGVLEGVPTTLQINVSTAANRIKTRSNLLESEERKIYDLYLWIFNSSGSVEYSHEYSRADLYQAASNLETSTGQKDPDAPTSMGLLKDINLTTGSKKIFLLANYKSGSDGLLQVDDATLQNVSHFSDLDKVKASMVQHTLFRPNGNLLMSLTKDVTITSTTKNLDVALERSEAQITFNITTAANLVFKPETYRVSNIPQSTFIASHPKGTAPESAWDAGGVDKKEYWGSDPFHFDGNETTTTFTFYMPENRKNAKKPITESSPGYDANKHGYDLRQKQLKTPVPGKTEKPNLTNGDTEYAPTYAPYIEFTGDLHQQLTSGGTTTESSSSERFGRVTYRIYLGYTSPTDPVNDYDIERNVHYTYNVRINGVNDLVIEAKSDKDHEEEPSPGTEGVVYDSHRSFTFDCHYEQGLMRFSKDEVGIFKTDGSLSDNAMLSFAVRTPFCDKIVTYTKKELEALALSDYKSTDASKKADTGWLRFYVHPSTLNSNNDETMEYYSNTGANLLTLEEFLYKMMLIPDDLFNAKTGECKVTIFANEYFYEQDPMRENAPKDKDLWKIFANAQDRVFDLLVNNSEAVSPDGASRYHQSLVSIRQMSIKTIFVNCPEGMRVWGIENVDETKDLDWSVKAPTEPDGFYNKYYTNGWQNTWTTMARHGDFQQDVLCDPMNKGKDKSLWQSMTTVNNGRLSLNKGFYQGILRNYHADYACFSPFVRNRDDNRNGQMEASELKWYIPSVAETSLICAAERALPLQSRLYGHAPYPAYTAFYTSKAFMGSGNGALYSSNPMLITAETQSMTPLLNFTGYQGGNPGDRVPYSTVRLIRDLGILETSKQKSYHTEEMNKEQQKSLLNERTLDSYLTFRADNISFKCLRSQRSTYELPSHDEKSQVNTIYEHGFEVAKYLANKISIPKNLQQPNRVGEYYYELWSTLQHDIEYGNSPCAYYYQKADKSDLGTWRVPNQVELEIMSGSLFDWDPREAKAVYPEFANQILPLNPSTPTRFHSRTGFSSIIGGGTKSFRAGYQLYMDGYLRYVTTVDTPWAGDANHTYNDKMGYVRCVRDLP